MIGFFDIVKAILKFYQVELKPFSFAYILRQHNDNNVAILWMFWIADVISC